MRVGLAGVFCPTGGLCKEDEELCSALAKKCGVITYTYCTVQRPQLATPIALAFLTQSAQAKFELLLNRKKGSCKSSGVWAVVLGRAGLL